MERGIDHAQRPGDALAQELIERLARDHRDQMSQHVGRDAVVPLRARLRDQRNVRRNLHHLGQRLVRCLEVDAAIAVLRIDRRRLHEAVGQPRRMRQQIAERDVALRRHRFQLAAHAAREHAHVLEARQKAGDRIVELEAAFLVQHHDRRRGQRLGHRVETEDRIRRHARLALDVRQAAGIEVRHLAVPRHHRDHAGHLAVIHQPLCPGIDARQPFRRQTDVFRFRHHRLLLRIRPAPRAARHVSTRSEQYRR